MPIKRKNGQQFHTGNFSNCPYCTKVQQVLKLAKLEHVVYKLDDDFDRNEFYDKFGQGSTFPQVIVDDKSIGGCMETVKYLREQKLV